MILYATVLCLLCPLTVACTGGDEPVKPSLPTAAQTTAAPVTTAVAQTTQMPEEETMKLKIGSYNIRHGGDANLDMSKLAGNITKLGLDIVGLQEVDQLTRRVEGIDTMQELCDATGYAYYCFFKAIDFRGGEYGVGVLSKYPIVETERILLPSEGYEQRVLGRATVNVDGVLIPFFVTHLSYEDLSIRTEQFARVAEILKAYDGFILTGDFNTANFAEFSVIENAYTVNNSEQKRVTFPGGSAAIDNIVYHTEAWSFGAPKTYAASYSDHYLLYSEAIYICTLP